MEVDFLQEIPNDIFIGTKAEDKTHFGFRYFIAVNVMRFR